MAYFVIKTTYQFARLAAFMRALPSPPNVIYQRDQSEYVLLADCKDSNGSQSSEMAYYASSPSGNPASIAIGITNPGETVKLESGYPISATFPNGDVFTVTIPSPLSPVDRNYAGAASNNYGSFAC
jgi:hypothetical protein